MEERCTGMAKSRNQLLNIVEAIATFLVVFIHFPFPGRTGAIVTAIAKISVPFYFCISGYFFYKGNVEEERACIPRKIKRLLLLMLFSELTYFLFYSALQIQNIGFRVQAFVNAATTQLDAYFLAQPLQYLLVFAPPFNGILWFVGSLVVVYAVAYSWCGRNRSGLTTSMVLLFLGIMLRRVLFYAGVDTTFPYERLLPFLPLPFFMIGYNLHKYHSYFDAISDRTYGMIILGGVVLTVLESFTGVHTLYFGTLLIVCAVIPFCAKHAHYSIKTMFGQLLSHIGGNTATYIYVLHILVGNVLYVIVPRVLHISNSHVIYQWGIPIMICVASVIAAEAVYIMKRIVFGKRR